MATLPGTVAYVNILLHTVSYNWGPLAKTTHPSHDMFASPDLTSTLHSTFPYQKVPSSFCTSATEYSSLFKFPERFRALPPVPYLTKVPIYRPYQVVPYMVNLEYITPFKGTRSYQYS